MSCGACKTPLKPGNGLTDNHRTVRTREEINAVDVQTYGLADAVG